MTNFYLSYSKKLTLFSFINSALIPFFVDRDSSKGHAILIDNMLMKFLVNDFVTPLMWTINFSCVKKKYRQYLIEREGENTYYNQKELNELYELQNMNVAARYSYIAKTLLMTFLFIPIFPLGLGISLLGFIFAYWIEKYNFANMYKNPEKLDKQIAEYYSNYFILIFYAYYLGDSFFCLVNFIILKMVVSKELGLLGIG